MKHTCYNCGSHDTHVVTAEDVFSGKREKRLMCKRCGSSRFKSGLGGKKPVRHSFDIL